MMNFDELNIIQYTDEEADAWLTEYFEPMELPEGDKRKDAAMEYRNVLLLILLTIASSMEYLNRVDWDYMESRLSVELSQIARKYAREDDFMKRFAEKSASDFIEVTKRRYEEPYFRSDDRALNNGANFANMTLGYEELQTAIEEGKTKKKWISEKDRRVRHTHRIADGQTVPIKAMFRVGRSLLSYPTDPEGDPEEIVNCRCHLKFL